MSNEDEIKQLWDTGLSHEESYLIGQIMAHWGALESEIFSQTLMTFEQVDYLSQLPKEMNNLRFTSVLNLWKTRVIDPSDEPAKSTLQKQYENIEHLKDYRNAMVHGMWEWSTDEPETLSTVRVRKNELLTTVFSKGDLRQFYQEVAQVNLYVRYPGGIGEALEEQMSQGGYVNQAELRRMKLRE
jgi:hypothetical protein